jgi:photosystem II stability/assembly factor-like uncharacterized protein
LIWARVLFAVALVSATVDHPGWRVIGPGGGGAQFHPTVSPHDPNRVLVSCDMTGGYLTEDGGRSWRMFNLGSTVRFFAFDQERPRVVYAQTTRLWRSEDGGRNWKPIYPVGARIEIDGDHAEEHLVPSAPPVDALWASGDELWGTIGNSLQQSKDGIEWRRVAELPSRARRIYADQDAVYILAAQYVAIWFDGHLKVSPHNPSVDESMGFVHGATDDHPVFYVASPSGLFVSDDGEHWRKSALEGKVRAVDACFRNGRVAYASYNGQGFGVAHTADAGATWDLGWHETRSRDPKIDQGGWVSERFGPGWGEAPLALAVAPSDASRAWGTDMGRTLYTTDSAKTWRAAYSRKLEDGAYTSTGLDVTTSYGVHVDPFDPKHIFISYTDIGLFASENGGSSWRSATTSGVPREWVNTTYWVEFDPRLKRRMWAAMSGTHDLPRPKMWRNNSPDRYRGGVVRSDDGGSTWHAMTNGMPPTAATHILLDGGSLFVTGFGRGVFRSDDGGETWALKNNGLPEHEPFAWRLAKSSDGSLYLVIARRSERGEIGDDRDGALYRSTDRGESWQKVNLPEGVNGPNGLAVDPQDPKRLYLAAWARDRAPNGGIFLSIDGGASWKSVFDADQHIYDVTIGRNMLYACGFESAAWRSADRGVTWSRIPGYDFKWGHRVVPDPSNAGMVYITTFGGSVWYGGAGLPVRRGAAR